MRDCQLYEILLFFALYSVLGWAADRCVFALRKRPGGHGLCRGPYMPAFGAAALLILAWIQPAEREMAALLGTDRDLSLPAAALCGLAAGGFCALAAGVLGRLCGGRWLIRVSGFDLLLWMAGSIIVVMHLHPLAVAVTRWMNPWIHMLFMAVFYLQMTGDVIDGIAALFRYRKQAPFQKQENKI